MSMPNYDLVEATHNELQKIKSTIKSSRDVQDFTVGIAVYLGLILAQASNALADKSKQNQWRDDIMGKVLESYQETLEDLQNNGHD